MGLAELGFPAVALAHLLCRPCRDLGCGPALGKGAVADPSLLRWGRGDSCSGIRPGCVWAATPSAPAPHTCGHPGPAPPVFPTVGREAWATSLCPSHTAALLVDWAVVPACIQPSHRWPVGILPFLQEPAWPQRPVEGAGVPGCSSELGLWLLGPAVALLRVRCPGPGPEWEPFSAVPQSVHMAMGQGTDLHGAEWLRLLETLEGTPWAASRMEDLMPQRAQSQACSLASK